MSWGSNPQRTHGGAHAEGQIGDLRAFAPIPYPTPQLSQKSPPAPDFGGLRMVFACMVLTSGAAPGNSPAFSSWPATAGEPLRRQRGGAAPTGGPGAQPHVWEAVSRRRRVARGLEPFPQPRKRQRGLVLMPLRCVRAIFSFINLLLFRWSRVTTFGK